MSQPDKSGNIRSLDNLFMDGSEIFSFTLRAVPRAVGELLEKTGLSTHDVDLYVFHQANKHMLDHLRTKMRIPEERFYVALRESGNTVSATIPIALKEALNDGTVRPGQRIMVVGFGVGYSWAAGLLRWVYGPTATA